MSQLAAAASGNADFRGACGEATDGYHSASCAGGMQQNQTATVNGGTPQNCVVGNDSAAVFAIDLQYQAGIYDYQIRVEAQGPDSFFGGSFYLAFQDQSGDVYYLSIFSSNREWHEVSYNSDEPNLVAIYWSDQSFVVDSADAANKAKANFQVISPVAAR